jgi:ribonuclease HII
MACSHYVIASNRGDWNFRFEPEADRNCLAVALASMVSKYLREVLMERFNRFWQERVPGLRPTAGYPSDAARFFAAIGPARQQLGIAENDLWRTR